LEPVVLLEHGLLNPVTQERIFPVSFFNEITVNMTSCSKVEEKTDEEEDRQKNLPKETNKTLAAL